MFWNQEIIKITLHMVPCRPYSAPLETSCKSIAVGTFTRSHIEYLVPKLTTESDLSKGSSFRALGKKQKECMQHTGNSTFCSARNKWQNCFLLGPKCSGEHLPIVFRHSVKLFDKWIAFNLVLHIWLSNATFTGFKLPKLRLSDLAVTILVADELPFLC